MARWQRLEKWSSAGFGVDEEMEEYIEIVASGTVVYEAPAPFDTGLKSSRGHWVPGVARG